MCGHLMDNSDKVHTAQFGMHYEKMLVGRPSICYDKGRCKVLSGKPNILNTVAVC